MPDDIPITPSDDPNAVPAATDEIGGRHYQIVKLAFGTDGSVFLVGDQPLPVSGSVDTGLDQPLTDAELRAAPVPVSGPLTDSQLRAAAVQVSAAALPLPAGAAAEATLVALKGVADSVATAAAAIQAAIEALDAKTTAVNTGAIAGSVTISGGTVGIVGAVEVVNDAGNPLPVSGTVSTGLDQPLTDAELRAAAVPVSAAALPLPAGAATEATLAALEAKLPAPSGGRLPVELPAGGGGLTDAELRASEVLVADDTSRNLLWRILQMLLSPLGYDKSLQRQRGTVLVESLPTLANVTTLAAANNLIQLNGLNADALVRAQINAAWALNVRSRIT